MNIPKSNGLTSKFLQIFKEKITQFYVNFPRRDIEGTLPKYFYKANITLTLKLGKDFISKKKERQIYFTSIRVKYIKQSISKLNAVTHKNDNISRSSWVYTRNRQLG